MVIKFLSFLQVTLVYITYILVKFFLKPKNYLWVIGVSETAQNIYRIGNHKSIYNCSLVKKTKVLSFKI